MSLLAIVITVTFGFSSPLGSSNTWTLDSWTVDASPQFSMPFPTRLWNASATTLPGVTLYDLHVYAGNDTPGLRDVLSNSPQNFAHELKHYRQQQYLGPWFFVAYALSNGDEFEPYAGGVNKGAMRGWTKDVWQAPLPSNNIIQQNYPVFRITNEGLTLFPGYNIF